MIPCHKIYRLPLLRAACIVITCTLTGHVWADARGYRGEILRNWEGEKLHGRSKRDDPTPTNQDAEPTTTTWTALQIVTPIIVGLSLLLLFAILVFYWKRKSHRTEKSFMRHIRTIFTTRTPRVHPEGKDEAWTIDSNTDSLDHSYEMVSHPYAEDSPLHLHSRWSPSLTGTSRLGMAFRRLNPRSAFGSPVETHLPGRATFRNIHAAIKNTLSWKKNPPTVVTSRLGPESNFDIFDAETDLQKSTQRVKWSAKGKSRGYDAISQEQDMDEDPRAEGQDELDGRSGYYGIANVRGEASTALSVDRETLADTVLLIRGDNPDFTVESESTEGAQATNRKQPRVQPKTRNPATLTLSNVHIIPPSPSVQSFHGSAPMPPPSPAPPPLLPPAPRQPAPRPPSPGKGHASSSYKQPDLRSTKSPSRTSPNNLHPTNHNHPPPQPLHHQRSETSVDQFSILGTPRQSQFFEKRSSAHLAPIITHTNGSAQRPGDILLQPNRHPDAYIPRQHLRSASNLSIQSADHLDGAFHQQGWSADDDRASIMLQKNPMELDDTNAYLTTPQGRRHERNLSNESFMSASGLQTDPDKRNHNGRQDGYPLSARENYQATFAGRESISESSGWEGNTQYTEEMGSPTSSPPARPTGSGGKAFVPSRSDTVMLFPGSVRGAGYTVGSQRHAVPIPSPPLRPTTNARQDYDAHSHAWPPAEVYGYKNSGEISPGGGTWETESSGRVSAFPLQQPANVYVKNNSMKQT